MRITTWNCRRGPLTAKLAAMEQLQSDVLVLTEVPRFEAKGTDRVWFGNSRNGVAVFAREPYRLQFAGPAVELPCVYPVRVTGPHEFTLLAVWTWQEPSYYKALI